MCKLALSSLSPENYPFDVNLLPQPVYLVGGAVRDAILGRKRETSLRDTSPREISREYLDLDFILPQDAVKFARKLAAHYKAGFVLLDKEREIARVVFPNATVDIAQQEGNSLETDLRRRDFTVNAIAFNPHTQELIDPLQGYDDIGKGILRMVSSKNLEDDPLRLMRGYRQAAQLGFTLDSETQVTIRQLAPLLGQVATERFRTELGYMLVNSQGTQWIVQAWEDGLLAPFFKNATREGCEYLLKVDAAAVQLTQTWQELGIELNKYVRDTIKTTWLGIAKLACLVSSEPETAEIELTELTYSRAEIKSITTALKLFPKFSKLEMPLREQYFLFQEAGFVFPTTSVLAVARDKLVEGIAPLITRYLNPDDPVAHPTLLVSGKELIVALNIPASPIIGKLLAEIAIAQVEGKISTPEDAIVFAQELIE